MILGNEKSKKVRSFAKIFVFPMQRICGFFLVQKFRKHQFLNDFIDVHIYNIGINEQFIFNVLLITYKGVTSVNK